MAEPYIGAGSRLAFAREPTQGKKVAPSRFLGIVHQGFEFPYLQREIGNYSNVGSGQRAFGVFEKKRTYPSSFSFLPTTGEFFYYILSTEDYQVNTPSSGINTHTLMTDARGTLPGGTLVTNANSPQTMSLGFVLENSPNLDVTSTGLAYDSCTVSLTEGNEMVCNVDTQSRRMEDWDIASPTLFSQPAGTNLKPYMFYDRAANITLMGTYNQSTNAMSGGRSFAAVKGFNLTIRRNLKVHHFTWTGDTIALTVGTSITVTNGSAAVTGIGTAFSTELMAGNRVRFGSDTTAYTIQSVTNNTSLTLTRTYGGTTGTVTSASQVLTDPQDPAALTYGYPTFELTLDVTPRGKLGGSPATQTGSDTDAILDLLMEGVKGDILLPFQRATNDRIDFVILNALIQSAPQNAAEDGNEQTVPCVVQSGEMRVVVRDAIASYATL